MNVSLRIYGRCCHPEDSGAPSLVLDPRIEVLDDSGVGMVLLGMMGLVEDEKINLVDVDEGVMQALVENLCCADNGHVVGKHALPQFLAPQMVNHLPAELVDGMIQVAIKHSMLLKDERDFVDEEKRNSLCMAIRSISHLLFNCPAEK